MAFKVAEPKDLCRNLQEAVDEDHSLPDDIKVEDALKSWIDQPGYPLITVIRNYESNEIVVNQQRFLSSREEVDTEGLSWYIPLSITTSKNPDMNDTKPSVWLKGGTRELVLRTSENLTWTSEDWVVFNVDQTGYYRVNYDTQNWKLLADELHKGFPYTIGTLNRAQIIDDAFNLAYSDVVHFTMALDIIKYVKYENEYSVWITANRHLLNMNRRLDGHSYELYYGRFLQHLTEDHFAHLDVFEDFYGRDSIAKAMKIPIVRMFLVAMLTLPGSK
uniref:ERAP1-like C-terminal domain-containing protein n=1 Tax=Phlebotomus papatasi TaxID=29031 RepID=A0A1B0D9N3_PHLPP